MQVESKLDSLEFFLSRWVDVKIFYYVLALLAIGITMVTSTTVEMSFQDHADPFFYLKKQVVFITFGLFLIFLMSRIRLIVWESLGPLLLVLSLALLALVLVPGIGREVNGSSRWIVLGPIGLQVSEFAKIATIIYLSGYLTRHAEQVQTSFKAFFNPIIILSLIVFLLILEPDFGSAVVFTAIIFSMLFLGGVRFSHFLLFALVVGSLMALLAVSDDYRLDRITSFTDPWADPYEDGFQLIQALIAIGNGGLFGVGVGESIQKLFYLPEAHNDFVFAVLAEETGLFGVILLLACYFLLIRRCFVLAKQAQSLSMTFAKNIAYGCGVWFALQTVISLSVNMGMLPTKGLSLPFLSVGGSNLLASCLAIGLLMRVYLENNLLATRSVSQRRNKTAKRRT